MEKAFQNFRETDIIDIDVLLPNLSPLEMPATAIQWAIEITAEAQA